MPIWRDRLGVNVVVLSRRSVAVSGCGARPDAASDSRAEAMADELNGADRGRFRLEYIGIAWG
jgi:hypothetical protein